MKKRVRFLALFLVSALLFGNCYTVKATTPESAVTDTAEGYLSLLAREMYLYEEADVTPFTLSSRNMELQPKVAMEMWQTDELIKVEEDLKTIEDIAEFTKYYRKASGITRENFNVDYTFDDIQIDGEYATLTAKEHISFHYTHIPGFEELTELINTYWLELANVEGNWVVVKMTSDCIFTPEEIESGIDLKSAIAQVSEAPEYEPASDDEGTTEVGYGVDEIPFEVDEPIEVDLIEMTEEDKAEWERVMEETYQTPVVTNEEATAPAANYTVHRAVGYDKNAAIQYAKTYWGEGVINGFNWRNEEVFHEYGQYEGQGDCQNFASQCIYAGLGGSNAVAAVKNKLRPAVPGTSTNGWYGSPNYTGCSKGWFSTSGFRNYHDTIVSNKSALLTSAPREFIPTKSSKPSKDIGSNYKSALLGSLAHVYGNSKQLGHAIFITSVNGDSWSQVLYTAHSPSALNAAITDFIGPNKQMMVFTITGMRDSRSCAYSGHQYSSPTNNNYDCTCNSCGFVRLMVRPTSPSAYADITYGTTKSVGGSATRFPDNTSGTGVANKCYQTAMCVTKPDGSSAWAPAVQNASSISTSIKFNQRGIWKIEVVGRDIAPTLAGSTSVSNTFTIRVK